jgi:hypothetical protein
MTDKIADQVHIQAAMVIPPKLLPDTVKDGTMVWTRNMERHSRQVDSAVNKNPQLPGLISTVGKHWITHDKLRSKKQCGVNYGWHDKKAPYRGKGGISMWQTVGTRHNWSHVDYSQVLVPVNRVVLINGEEMLIEDVMRHPTLSSVLSYDGPMRMTRHPDVEPPKGGVQVSRI